MTEIPVRALGLQRTSRETQVRIVPSDALVVDTGLAMFDHLLATLLRYADLSVAIYARGDLKHHLIEDVGITLGAFVAKSTPAACARYAERTLAMDDALVRVVIDVSGRPYYRGVLPNALYQHFLQSFAFNAAITLHLDVLAGSDRHHIHEAAFKALGLSLKQAMVVERETFSTKGRVTWENLL
jgi:imidazoleglycerol-phosphate dehydratase